MAQRIIVSVTNDLVTDQRVHRTCTALHEAGYEVTLVGRRLPGSAPVTRPYRTVRMRLLFKKKAFFYAEYNLRLFLKLLFARADALYANDTDTLPATWWAARLRRLPMCFDAHELFPEVPELVGRPRVKAFWSGIEKRLLPRMAKRKATAAMTVCQSIADHYEKEYGLKMSVVRNVPMRYPDPADCSQLLAQIPQGKRILLYQGAVNVGRGIEWIMEAMPLLEECHMVVAGTGDLYEALRERCRREGLAERVTFLGRVEPEVLHSLTRHADLGLSLLENRGLNYYYSLPNRLADFVQAGVPVLATDFPEIRRVVAGYGVGTLLEAAPFDPKTMTSTPPDPQTLATAIRQTLAHFDGMEAEKRQSRFERAAGELSWDKDKKILLHAVDTIFQ